MSVPDPEGMSMLAKVLAAAAVIGAPIFGAIKYVDGRFDKKADKDTVNEEFGEVKDEMKTQRQRLVEVFEQMRENEQRAQDRHERLMERLT